MNNAQLTQIAADAVGAAQRQFPPEIRSLARGVAVHYENLPGDDVLAEGFPRDILGLFTGNPHGGEFTHDSPVPAQIFLYIDNLWAFSDADPSAFKEEVRLTYLHEFGHFLGWDEDELTARGLD